MKFYGQFNPPVDQVLYEKYFQNKRNGLFIECGAYDGLVDSCGKFFEENMGWKGINIEASPRLFERLLANRATSFLNLNIALSNKNGLATFSDIISPSGIADGNGSLTHKEIHVEQILKSGCKFKPIEVPTIRFTDLIKEHSITHIDFMALDVEGHEIEVIEGMISSPCFPDIMCVEYAFFSLDDIKKPLETYGYRLDFLKEANAFFSKISK